MPSPFPGMDPFIESRRIWTDFYLDLAAAIRAHLHTKIQPAYYATAATYVTYDVVEVAQSQPRAVSPDVSLWRTTQPLQTPDPGAIALIDPPLAQSIVRVEAPVRLARVEVRAAGTDTLVTSSEILAPMPLSAPDADVPLALGALVQAVYTRGGYATRIDYRQSVPPPLLTSEQQAWVERLLATHR